jgi:hypothetical protein
MRGDFSRQSYRKDRHYNSVLLQQGRVQVDADWNEQQAIHRHRMETQSTDVIGLNGAPKTASGFQIKEHGNDLLIGKGHFYVDGILCENEKDDLLFSQQADLPSIPSEPLDAAVDGGIYLAYLEVWDRHITALEDASIRETALGGPDTATRAKTVWQVRLLQVTNPSSATLSCTTVFPEWTNLLQKNLIGISNIGTLTAQSRPVEPSPDPLCVLPLNAGYRRLENQLYRIEIHKGGTRAQALFKWSRDNGTVASAIEADESGAVIRGSTIHVTEIGKDGTLTFASDPLPEWVELTDDRYELQHQHGVLASVQAVDVDVRTITLTAGTLPVLDQNHHPLVRRWDQSGSASTADGIAMAGDWQPVEDGLEIRFGDGVYRPGDFWLIPARTAIGPGAVEWPTDGVNPLPQPPEGTQHHFAPLALLQFTGGAFAVVTDGDCRVEFPPLNHITAADVFYDNTNCQVNLAAARTVQDALDTLCSRQGGGCQIQLVPGLGWEAPLLAFADTDAEICFQAGLYETDKRIVVQNKGHLAITGIGPGTRIVAKSDEVALEFSHCTSVTIHDLYIESRRAGSPPRDRQVPTINGALTFRNCGSVNVERVALRCGSAPDLAAACLTVANLSNQPATDEPGDGSVRIQDCDLRVGFLQSGILLINVTRARVSGNLIRAGKRHKDLSLKNLLKNKRFRSTIRELLMTAVVLDPTDAPPITPVTTTLAIGGMSVRFATHDSITNGWDRLFKAIKPRGVQNSRDLRWHLENVIDKLLLHEGSYPSVEADRTAEFEEFYRLLQQSMQSIGGQGIVVGGQIGKDIQIDKNTILGMLVGIKAGVSRNYALGEPHDRLDSVQIVNNEIGITLAPSARLRFGIFVGNCNRLSIENNNIQVTTLPATRELTVDGIRVWGLLGEKIMIRHNSILQATTGIRIHPTNIPGKTLWLVKENVMPGAKFDPPASVIHNDTNVI